ncbi:MAG: hypothetical protein GYB68_18420, partial [Chloroflexi bacterium]|nr:hypothetical protein [Chloroflexota bacterium]
MKQTLPQQVTIADRLQAILQRLQGQRQLSRTSLVAFATATVMFAAA